MAPPKAKRLDMKPDSEIYYRNPNGKASLMPKHYTVRFLCSICLLILKWENRELNILRGKQERFRISRLWSSRRLSLCNFIL
ncbi:hypothetical protein E2C01_035736 [Portunus trituberculatus]|uniref:Uncharacterized protein n=1 Tax=Portunus trituberculatus TaxID=210409 RepID=A0A5B7F6Q4_PORTR|nr:hypothetical protein [Portunus trituberculatus]